MLQPQSTGQGSQIGIDNIQEYAMNVVYMVASIITLPIEIFLRPWFGTTYFPAPVLFMSAIMMVFWTALFGLAVGLSQMIPFVSIRGPVGMFGMGSFTSLFFLASFAHGFRTWRLMLHMEREQNSVFEGPPLPFFKLMPKGTSFWFVRIVYEPIFVFALAIMLANMFIIQSPLKFYFEIAALFLAMKNYVAWYKTWAFLRQLMDVRYVGPIIAKAVNNTATDDELATVHLASLPKNLPDEMRSATVAHIARAYSVPQESVKRNPEAGNSQLKFIFLALIVSAFVFFSMGGLSLYRQIANRNQPRASVRSPFPGKAKKGTGRGITPSQNMSADDLAAHVAVAPGKAPLFKLVGYWTGKSMIANRGACDIKLEVRPTPENQFSGFVTVGCLSFMQPKKIAPGVLSQLGKETPVSAVLSGGWDATAGSLKLLATKNIGFDQSGKGCAMTSLTVTPFGKGQVAAEWQDPACSGGQMILARSTP